MAVNVNVGGNTGPLERDVRAAISRINKSGGLRVRMDDKGVTQPLGNMKRSADEFTKSLEASNARVLAFGASVGIINAVTDAFKGLVNATMQVQKNLTDINVVMGLSNQQLDKFGSGLFKVAAETGAGFQEASKAATEFARQGLTVNETLKRTKDALILTRLTGMDAADSVKSLTAAMNTFGHQVDNSTQLVSKFAAVDVKFAVSAKDFAEAIARAGQSAKSAGVDLDSFVGMVTAVQEKTARGGAVIGNAFKTILTRTQRPQTLKAMENLGVQVRNLNGEVLAADKILLNLSKRWDTLTSAQKANIGQTTAGMFQINLLKAILEDMGEANSRWSEAMGISNRATDESNKKNEQLRATMSALATETGVAVQELAKTIGDLALAPGINKVLESLKGITEWLNNTLGGGEEEGNKFAKGLVAGMGNFLSGPGLVMFAAVMGKLFVNAVKYGAQSLSSLLNINKAASKRKSIEQAVLAVLTQNSRVQKEMLSTKLTQEKKEAIILNLIKQQTIEAAKLQSISRSMVGPLVRSGVGPNLKMKARGHVPNFANPEKDAAREAGYAPGGVREKNIPGAGRVIYNSAETVRSFAGLSQPAIMPPEGSRAGASYRQAFSGAHGFDPYAAGGYVPNFNRAPTWTTGRTNTWYGKGEKNPYKSQYAGGQSTNYLDLNQLLGEPFMQTMGVMTGQGSQQSHKVNYTQSLASVPELRDRLIKGLSSRNPKQKAAADTLAKNTKVRAGLFTRGVYPTDDADVQQLATGNRGSWSSTIKSVGGLKGATDDLARKVRDKIFGVGKGEVKVKNGDALNHLLSEKAWQGYMLESAVKAGMGRQLDVGKESQRAFDIDGASGNSNVSPGLRSFMGLPNLRGLELKNSEGAGKGAGGGLANKVMNRIFQDYAKSGRLKAHFEQKIAMAASSGAPKGITAGSKGAKHAAFGFVPNFAIDGGLVDSIGREQTAMRERGLPVSAVRVGIHQGLQTGGNPVGWGVTNTHDEPNGLKDVMGARGFVPNFQFNQDDFKISGRHESKRIEMAAKANKSLAAVIVQFKKGKIKWEVVNKAIEGLTLKTKDQASIMQRVTKKAEGSITWIDKLNQARRAATSGLGRRLGKTQFARGMSGKNASGIMGTLGKFQGGDPSSGLAGKIGGHMTGMGGMMGMMALSMGSGFVQQYDPKGTNKGIQGTAGAMSGAGTGASIGMMFGPLGMAIGGVVGGLMGFTKGLKEAEVAAFKLAKAEEEAKESYGRSAGASAFGDDDWTSQAASISSSAKTYLRAGSSSTGVELIDDIYKKRELIEGEMASLRKGSDEEQYDKQNTEAGKETVRKYNLSSNKLNKISGDILADYFKNNRSQVFEGEDSEGNKFQKTGKEIESQMRRGVLSTAEMKGYEESARKAARQAKAAREKHIESLRKRVEINKIIARSESMMHNKLYWMQVGVMEENQKIKKTLTIWGDSLSASAKGQMKYEMDLNNARSKLRSSDVSADEKYKSGLLGFIKGNDSARNSFEDAMQRGPVSAALEAQKLITAEQLDQIKNGKIEEVLLEMKGTQIRKIAGYLNDSVSLEADLTAELATQEIKRDGLLQKNQQEFNLTKFKLDNERKLNKVIESRKDILDSIKRKQDLMSTSHETRNLRERMAKHNLGGEMDLSLMRRGGGTSAEQHWVKIAKLRMEMVTKQRSLSRRHEADTVSTLIKNFSENQAGGVITPKAKDAIIQRVGESFRRSGGSGLIAELTEISKTNNPLSTGTDDAAAALSGIKDWENTKSDMKLPTSAWTAAANFADAKKALEENVALVTANNNRGNAAGEELKTIQGTHTKGPGIKKHYLRDPKVKLPELPNNGNNGDNWSDQVTVTVNGKEVQQPRYTLSPPATVTEGQLAGKDPILRAGVAPGGIFDERGSTFGEQKPLFLPDELRQSYNPDVPKIHDQTQLAQLIFGKGEDAFNETSGIGALSENLVTRIGATRSDEERKRLTNELEALEEVKKNLLDDWEKEAFTKESARRYRLNKEAADLTSGKKFDKGRVLKFLTEKEGFSGSDLETSGKIEAGPAKGQRKRSSPYDNMSEDPRAKRIVEALSRGERLTPKDLAYMKNIKKDKKILDSPFHTPGVADYALHGRPFSADTGLGGDYVSDPTNNAKLDLEETVRIRGLEIAKQNQSKEDGSLEPKLEKARAVLDVELEKVKKLRDDHEHIKALKEDQTKKLKNQLTLQDEQTKELKDQLRLEEEKLRVAFEYRQGADAFGNGMNEAFKAAAERSALFKFELGKAIPEAFSRSMSDAMMKLIREGGEFKDAMMDVGINFLNTINQKFMENWMDKFMGSFYDPAERSLPDEDSLKIQDANQKLLGLEVALQKTTDPLNTFTQNVVAASDKLGLFARGTGVDGGFLPEPPAVKDPGSTMPKGTNGFWKTLGSSMWQGIQSFAGIKRNKGGQIPTMLTSGEYVMRKSAVDKMGTAGMDALNKGVVPGRHKGGPAPGSNEAWSAAFGADWDMRASGKQNSHVAKYYKRLAEKKKEPTIADIFSKPINRRKSRISSDYAAEGTSLAEIFGFPSRKKKEPTLADIFSSPLPQKANEPPSFYGGKRGAAGKLPKRFQEKLKRLKAGSPNLEDLFKLGVPFDRKNAGGAMMGSLGMAGMSYLMGRKADKDARKEAEYQERPDDYFQKNPAYKKYKMSTAFMQRDRRVQEDVSKHREKKEEELQAWIQKKNRQQDLGRAVVSAVGNFAMSKLGDQLNSKTGWGSKETGEFDSDGNAIRQSAFGRFDDSLGYKKMGYKMESWGLNKQQARLNKQQSSFGQSDLSGGDYQAKWDQYYSNEDLLNSNQGRLAELSTLQSNAPRSVWQKTGSWASGGGYKNAGGKISGPAGIDVIPAMLTEGEYVINANAAKKIGMPTLERINAGKFNEGGVVGDKTGETPSSSPSSNTNNISITVNVKGDSEGTSEGKGEEKDNKNEMMDKLSQRIKQQVVTVIREENRPGGLLRS